MLSIDYINRVCVFKGWLHTKRFWWIHASSLLRFTSWSRCYRSLSTTRGSGIMAWSYSGFRASRSARVL